MHESSGNPLLCFAFPPFPVAFSAALMALWRKIPAAYFLVAAAGSVLQNPAFRGTGGPLSESHSHPTSGANAIIHCSKMCAAAAYP
jgi:hypothetical protein